MWKSKILRLFWPGFLRFIFLFVTVIGLCYLASGINAVWIGISILLGLWLIKQVYFLNRLAHWLSDEDYPLQGSGVWGEIFEQILNLRRNSLKRKKALSDALNRFNRVTEVIPNGIIILTEGRIEWLNMSACEHLNLNFQNDVKHFLRNLIRLPDFQSFLNEKVNKSLSTIHITLPKGEHFERIVQVTRLPFDEKSELLLTQDITEKTQLDENQIAFIANVSHELRTPLTTINGFTETLIEIPELPLEKRQQFLGLMQKEGQRMIAVLTDLLTLTRLEKGQNTGDEFQCFNLSNMIMQIATAAENLSRKHHQFTLDIQSNLYFCGLESDLYSALSNIVFNAVRYTPTEGRITICLNKISYTQALFSVTDTGIGIAPEHIPRLTERFYRVDNARSKQTGGTGLGLAITKYALAKYNMTLDIQSTFGKGSCFRVVLPITTQH